MSRVSTDKPLVPSILDRLIDERPDLSREPAKSQHQVLADLRRSVQRDLEYLLNARCRCTTWPADLTELAKSLVGYGIPDITAANLRSGQGRREFLQRIERTIRMFEPRFKSVRVLPVQNANYLDRSLRFRIDAMLYAYPAPEPVVFDSELQPENGTFSVKGAAQ